MKIEIVDFQGGSLGERVIPSFGVDDVNTHLIWEVIKAEQANLRQGTHKTKVRGEVRGGGAKPWRQKGTGRARAGSNRSPIWKGGGTIFGPRSRNYRENLPRKKKQAGLRHILTDKLVNGKGIILKEFALDEISTRKAHQGICNVIQAAPFFEEYSKKRKVGEKSNQARRTITIVFAEDSEVIKKSIRNLPWVQYLNVTRMAALPMFYNHGIVFTEKAFDKLEKILEVS